MSVSFQIGAVLWPPVAFLAWLLLAPKGWHRDSADVLAVLGGVFGPMMVLLAASYQVHKYQIEPNLDALSRLDDPRVVGLFLTQIPYKPPYWKPYIRPTLIRILPHLQRADTKYLPFQAQATLHSFLQTADSELILATLTALPNIGTISALPFVEPHAKGSTQESRDPQIQAAAQHCQSILTARADKVKGPDMTLLRASSAPTDHSILLRPTASSEASPAEQLLRAQS